MSLIHTENRPAFDVNAIHKGSLIYVSNTKWDKPKRGFVTYVSQDVLRIEYRLEISNMISNYEIKASELNEDYVIRWSDDLTEISEYPEREAENEP